VQFSELLSMEGVREECDLRGPFGFMAFHGGELEQVTDVIARAAAERAGASYYGVLQPDNLEWHIPSHRVTSDQSPLLGSFLSHVQVVVTVHGYGRAGFFTSLLLGGGNRRLAAHLGGIIRRHLPAYDVIDDIDRIPKDLLGLHQDNPVNVPPHSGVQLELPPRVRGSSPMFWDWEGPEPSPHTQRLIDALVECAVTWPG
jgi:phage replication-related protein YjqB (UPF0714/DUF867 family)